ncbi:RELT-like protein 2 isoform X1 [Micropterus salmoides]|uniref:RELT-like protein 2 isoform X1 n=2 Tax=Micropterus salmoides TaxID=27706 RepID=UPI0018EBB89C|nr:RELT-like protein 2 isoform X1 [Micropterus salmoides]XP_038555911.1 RELT-like protein 2 isoform X1 [Micropterus salmoides]
MDVSTVNVQENGRINDMTELEVPGVGEHPPPYMIFVVVFLFFLTGLFGFLICHLLKKKGYRCRTGDMDDEEEEEEKLGGNKDEEDEENQDTVEQILKCIIENEANMEAFNEMLGNHNVCLRHDPRLRKESIGGVPPHHHTVHSGTDHNSCHLCAQVRSKKGRRQSRTPRSKQRPGEQTVFSVGRFRVTHTDKKLHGSPHLFVSSGDQLDQSQDSEERKEGVYNLRSMFKDVRPPSESSNGVASSVGKRRKSVSIFGLRRGSDPVGIKVGEETCGETGGVRFAVHQQPVVLEELLHSENIGVASEIITKPGINSEIEFSKNQTPASPQCEAKNSGSVNSPSSQSKNQAHESNSALVDGSKHGPSLELHINLMIKPSIGSTAASAPSSLPLPSPASSGQIFKTTEKQGDLENKVLKNESYDPGPQQTSTPIAPMPGSIPSFTPVIPRGQPDPFPSTCFLVNQTPPDPSSSTDLKPVLGASLALISQGSSPSSSFPIKTPSSASSLKTSTSTLAVTLSPKLSSRNMPSEAAQTTISPPLPSGQGMSSQCPIPSSFFEKSTSPLQAGNPSPALTASPKLNNIPVSLTTPFSSPADKKLSMGSPCLSGGVTSMTKGDMVSSQLSLKEQELETDRIPRAVEKTEIRRVGILKTATLSPVEGDSKGFPQSCPTDQLERLNSLPLSPIRIRKSSVSIVKASLDSKREFSDVTMLESSTSISDQKGQTSEFGVKSKKARIIAAVGQEGELSVSGVGQPESQSGESSAAEVRPMVSKEKDDMVEMEDIRDCKVKQVEEAERIEEKL